ncbi:MAG: response regulator transcription factor [Alphaproteobacteria bacterium]
MKLLIADDHAMFRTAVSDRLAIMLGSNTHVLQADSYAKTLDLLRQEGDIDLAMVDLFMPGFDGFEGLSSLMREHPNLPVIVLSGSSDPDHQIEVIRRGARAYVVKEKSLNTLCQIVEIVRDGGSYFPPELVEKALRLAEGKAEPAFGHHNNIDVNDQQRGLTDRERQILQLLAKGASNKLIAREIRISEGTVKVHLRSIFRKLNVRNRTQAALIAREDHAPDSRG